MGRIFLTITALFLSFYLFTNNTFASGFSLKSIGQLSTEGKQIKQWWYTGLQPTFSGDAIPSSKVSISIDSIISTVDADTTGIWSFRPGATLAEGDHQIILKNNESEIKFTLTLGSSGVNWENVSSESGTSLPSAGTSWPTAALILLALGMFGIGAKMVNVSKK